MRVRSAETEGADTRAARRSAGLSVRQLGGDDEGAVGEIDLGIRFLVVDAGRDLTVLERQDGLEQAGHTGGRVEVSEVALDRADAAEALLLRACAKRVGERADLDRVAKRYGGRV